LYEEAINEPVTAHNVFSKIPEPNRTIAGFVVRFIHDYFLAPEIIEVTLMTPYNLATVLFPCVIRNPSSDLMEIMRHVEVEKAWMRKSFTSLDVSGFPSLDQCREQAGLTGKAAPEASASSDSPAKPTNPPPKPAAGAFPEKPTSQAPTLPPVALSPPESRAPVMLDFSTLNFSDSPGMSASGANDVTAILDGNSKSTMDFSGMPSFNFSSGSGMSNPGSGSSSLLSGHLNLTLSDGDIQSDSS